MECGLMLCGGGGRGAYQIGCWKALKECGFRIQSIAGVSVGGLNAALIAQDDLEVAIATWEEATCAAVYRWDWRHWMRAPGDGVRTFGRHLAAEWRHGRRLRILHRPALRALAQMAYRRGFFNTQSGLRELIARRLDHQRIMQFPSRIWITLLRLRGWLPWGGQTFHVDLKTVTREVMEKMLLATASPPFLFPSVFHGRHWLADAGMLSSPPAELVYQDGARLIFAIHLSPGRSSPAADLPGATVIDVCPHERIGTMLGFDPQQSLQNLERGCSDMLRVLEKLKSSE